MVLLERLLNSNGFDEFKDELIKYSELELDKIFSETTTDQIKELLERFPQENYRHEVINYVLTLIRKLYVVSRWKECITLIDEILGFQNAGLQAKEIVKLKFNKAIAIKEMGKYSEALSLLKNILSTAGEDDKLTALCNNTLGSIFYNLSDYSDALEYLLKAHDYWLKLGDEGRISQSLNNIASIYKNIRLYDKAIFYFEKSIKIKKKLGLHNGVALSLVNQGSCLSEQDKYDLAKDRYEQALTFLGDNLMCKTASMAYNNFGNLEMVQGNYDRALEYFLKSLDIKKKIGDESGLINTKLNLVEVYLITNQLGECKRLLKILEDLVLKFNSNTYLIHFFDVGAKYYEKVNDLPKAVHYLRKKQEISDKQNEQTFSNKVATLEIQYDFKQKELERELLLKKNQDLENKNRIIQKKNKELEDAYKNIRKSEISYQYMDKKLKKSLGYEIIGESESIQNIRKLIKQVAKADKTSVLITGESGTGKELVARAIHDNSKRANYNFISVNSAAIPTSLFESQFFGYKKNAFTGAEKDHIGFFELSDQGTLFLDEISAMPYDLQAKILRNLENSKIIPVGGNKEILLNTRVISASNKNLELMIEKNDFRIDLYHRLSRFIINIPPLRERKDDIPLLVDHFISFFSYILKKRITKVEKRALTMLCEYDFPGNIRELKNIIERAIISAGASILKKSDFILNKPVDSKTMENLNLLEAERRMILKALSMTSGNQAKSSKLLGITAKSLERRMIKHGIKTARSK